MFFNRSMNFSCIQVPGDIPSHVILFFPKWYYSCWVSKLCLVGMPVVECSGHVCGQEHGRQLMTGWQLPCSQPQGHQHRCHTGRWAETGTILTTLDICIIPPGLAMHIYHWKPRVFKTVTISSQAAQQAGSPASGIITTFGFQCTGGRF